MAMLLQTEAPAIRVLFGRGLRALLREVVSKAIPTSVDAPENQVLIDDMTRALAGYFERLYADYPAERMARAINNAILLSEAEGELDDAEIVLIEWIAEHDEDLAAVLEEGIEAGLTAGTLAQIGEFIDDLDLTDLLIAPDAFLSPDIIAQARAILGDKIVGIDETTRDRIANIIANGLENRDGIDRIQGDILEFINDDQITTARARMIARTETADALGAGAENAARDVGAKEKQWITVGDDDVDELICIPNEAQGLIPFSQAFQSGHARQPGHPNCRCATTYHGVDPEKLKQRAA
jgi:hypothetical protein